MALDNKKNCQLFPEESKLEGEGSRATFPDWGWEGKGARVGADGVCLGEHALGAVS